MSSLKWVVQLIPLILLICVCEAEQKLSTKECENLGFTGLALCSDCHTFAEYIKDQDGLCRRWSLEVVEKLVTQAMLSHYIGKVGYNLKHVGLAFSGAPFCFYHIKTASELHMYGIPNLLAEYKKLLSSTTIS